MKCTGLSQVFIIAQIGHFAANLDADHDFAHHALPYEVEERGCAHTCDLPRRHDHQLVQCDVSLQFLGPWQLRLDHVEEER